MNRPTPNLTSLLLYITLFTSSTPNPPKQGPPWASSSPLVTLRKPASGRTPPTPSKAASSTHRVKPELTSQRLPRSIQVLLLPWLLRPRSPPAFPAPQLSSGPVLRPQGFSSLLSPLGCRPRISISTQLLHLKEKR